VEHVSLCTKLALLPIGAYLLLPTFQNRIKYFVYDYDFIKRGTYLPGANDGARAQSYKAGWAILQQHPLGVGAGDVRDKINDWYTANIPDMVKKDRLLPSSEWLVYSGFAGWISVVLFTIIMCLPFFITPKRHRIFWWLLTGTLAASHLFDVGLEVQYGVFIYAFFVLWWWKWFSLPQPSHLHKE
jgi:O-antigen ligase